MFTLKSFCLIWLLLSIASEILSMDYLHFGGTKEESRLADYYLSVDSGNNIGPKEELKRTNRSLWKKLFKNNLFGERENSCNNYNYNAGNVDNYNPALSPLLPFKSWCPLPLWQPLQPLLGPLKHNNSCDNGNNNNYVNPPVTENNYSTPETRQYSNGKTAQIIYQPIIYVSPQYQVKQEETKYKDNSNNDFNRPLPIYETESDNESEQPAYTTDADNTKLYLRPETQTPVVATPYSQTNAAPCTQPFVPCLSHPSPNSAVSTAATVYNIITPSYHDSPTTDHILYTARVTTPNVPYASDIPSKYSLQPFNVIPMDSYSLPTPAIPSAYLSPPSSMQKSTPTQTYLHTMHLSSDDQPFRVCPELFMEYQRKLNTILPHMNGGREKVLL